ncbi:MAG: hypothetical protein ACREE9_05920 [Stellaceae bacterium]
MPSSINPACETASMLFQVTDLDRLVIQHPSSRLRAAVVGAADGHLRIPDCARHAGSIGDPAVR